MVQEKTRLKICGVDPSTTCSGIALLEGDELVEHQILDMKKNKDTLDRTQNMIFELSDFISHYSPDIVYVEEPNGKSVKVVKLISNIIGGIMYACYCNDADFHVVTASGWRSTLGIPLTKNKTRLKRDELKAEDIRWVKEHYKFDCGDDEADAICIAHAGLIFQENDDMYE